MKCSKKCECERVQRSAHELKCGVRNGHSRNGRSLAVKTERKNSRQFDDGSGSGGGGNLFG